MFALYTFSYAVSKKLVQTNISTLFICVGKNGVLKK